jgi:hypothetical protein
MLDNGDVKEPSEATEGQDQETLQYIGRVETKVPNSNSFPNTILNPDVNREIVSYFQDTCVGFCLCGVTS